MHRVKELDSIRGLAALTIMVHHLWLGDVAKLGLAVNWFFLISGYLITSIILKNPINETFLLAFYVRRSLRIWPIYYLTLLFLVAINPFLPTPGNLADLPYYLTYTQEVPHYWSASEPTFPHSFRHTWTLAIEEQFYLLWPALLFLVGRRGIPLLAAILVTAAVVARALSVNYFVLLTQCDGLALGGLLAYMVRAADRSSIGSAPRPRPAWHRGAGGVVPLVLAGCLAGIYALRSFWPDLVPPPLGKSLLYLITNLLFLVMTSAVVHSAGSPRLAWLRNRALVYLGTISYGLYLYHQVLFRLWDNFAEYHGWGRGLLTDLAQFAASIAIAAFSWHFLERPILALKDRFGYQADAAAGAGASGGQVADFGGVKMG
jgi:peptidoglycan/LPS O-acetylase OafA/YrhL